MIIGILVLIFLAILFPRFMRFLILAPIVLGIWGLLFYVDHDTGKPKPPPWSVTTNVR